MTSRPRTILLFAGLAAALAIAGCDRSDPKTAAAAIPAAVPVTTASVVQKDMPLIVRAIGNVEAQNNVGIKSLIAGELTEVHFNEGQDVNKGDLLFVIDPRQPQADLNKAEANLARDEAQARNSRADAQRYAGLFKEGVVSKQQLDTAVTKADADTAAVASDKAAVEYAKLQLTYTRIYSPITGRTGNLVVHRGNIIKENDNPALVTINQITPIYVTFTVPETQLLEVKRHMAAGPVKVLAKIKENGEVKEGNLVFVDNSVDATTGTIKLKGEFANPDRKLWPGQFVDVDLQLAMQTSAIVVPSQAIQTGQNGQFVFVVGKDMTVDMRPVTITRTLGNESIIASGVQAGETVVTDGQIRLIKGSKVEIKPAVGSQVLMPVDTNRPVGAP